MLDLLLRLAERFGVSQDVARKIPGTLFTVAIISGIIGFLINGRIQSEHITVLETQLTDLRQRFGVVPPENKFDNFTNSELRQRAIPLLQELRGFINALRVEYDKLYEPLRDRPPMLDTPDAIAFRNQFMTVASKYQDRFDRDFKVDLILLRDAMRRRLPKDQRATMPDAIVIDQMYQRPNMNTFVLTDIADDFERMTKSLP